MTIFCCQCQSHIAARLTTGAEVYPHRDDLHALPFWKCDTCGNWTGCHHKTSTPTAPLGCIPSPEIKRLRILIHGVLDPIWKRGAAKRGTLYAAISERLGKQYHTADIRTEAEAREVLRIVRELRDQYEQEATP
jgi:hypothetical protein